MDRVETPTEKLCECGCGLPAPIAKKTWRKRGAVAGQPQRFVANHNTPVAARPWAERYRQEWRGYATPCHVWIGAKITGYGVLTVEGRQQRAHRRAWEALNGPVPTGLQLDHLCRVKECVNPDHLEVVTNAENQRRGPRGKLTWAQVLEIRGSDVPTAALAARYGVTGKHIPRIRTNRAGVA